MTGPGDVAQAWASDHVTRLLEGRDDPPAYGSQQWLDLPRSDPRSIAAVLIAAEQWRQHQAEQQRLDELLDTDPDAWFAEQTADADDEAARTIRLLELSRQPTHAELAARRAQRPPAHVLCASPGWPPIRVPGEPGRYLTPPSRQETPAA